jgi:MIP family channel proteins
MKNALVLRFMAEAAGTFGLVFAAAGSVMVDDLYAGLLTVVGISLCSGLGVTTMIYTFGHISGAHINPAVTLGFAITGRIHWRDAGGYLFAQISGAVVAVQLLKMLFGTIAGLGGHQPSGSPLQALGLEAILTFVLMAVIMTTTIKSKQFGSVAGLVIGGTVTLCTLVGGPISGGSMNPARSFGPALIGWTWTSHWVYWVGPLLGSVLGAVVCSRLLKDWSNLRCSGQTEIQDR